MVLTSSPTRHRELPPAQGPRSEDQALFDLLAASIQGVFDDIPSLVLIAHSHAMALYIGLRSVELVCLCLDLSLENSRN
ncbi:hypothetical protein K7X08_029800 [Anisodus acutangulus]|uniref:Uncharacterized protein n=1 Tax=Anisodus acutangulus TaxID=402998 RepID=A0A9Q1MCG2_9SOLA|nr:hypothetical protein K7X08_029800 [Anisodus acutangulus]